MNNKQPMAWVAKTHALVNLEIMIRFLKMGMTEVIQYI